MAGGAAARGLRLCSFPALRQVGLRNRVVGALLVPNRRRDPPALAVPEKLDAVDAARQDRAVRLLPRLVRREHVGNVAESLRDAVDLTLVEPAGDHGGVGGVYELLVAHDPRRGSALRISLGR